LRVKARAGQVAGSVEPYQGHWPEDTVRRQSATELEMLKRPEEQAVQAHFLAGCIVKLQFL
jgi:hypothetical protein